MVSVRPTLVSAPSGYWFQLTDPPLRPAADSQSQSTSILRVRRWNSPLGIMDADLFDYERALGVNFTST